MTTMTALPFLPSKRKEKGRRSSSNKNHNSSGSGNGNGNGSTRSLCRTIYCPRTETTYEGEILLNTSNSSSHNHSESHTRSPSSLSSSSSSEIPFVIRHGKGTIHNHVDNTTLVGYFQNNQIVGHALQTFYDEKGICALAQYEGSFIVADTDTNTNTNTNTDIHNGHDHDTTNNNGNTNDSTNGLIVSNYNYIRHGFGKYSWPFTGDEYVGEFHNGVMSGKGTFTWGSTGDRYEGQWSKGKMHGKNGHKQTSSGDDFVGTYVKGKATGWGKKHFACGDIHDGMYRKDKRHGFGVYKWHNGDQYVGQWLYGRMVGRGIKSLVYAPERGNHGVYSHHMEQVHGNRNDDIDNEDDDDDDDDIPRIQRAGDITEIFYGSLVNDKAQGYGIKYYSSGDVYCGQYKDDMRDSYGEYTWSNDEQYSGQWMNGRMCGIGVKCMSNGDVYDGEFVDDVAHGFGVKTFGSNGDVHFGEYQNNQRHGKGLYRWSNGDEYEGGYVDGEQCGLGCYRWNNGTMTFNGEWKNGQKHGPGFFRVLVQSHNGTVSERIFFEAWCKGNRQTREAIDFTLDDLPDMEELPQYHAWKHIWRINETDEIHSSPVSHIIRSGNITTMPIMENATNSTLEPFADEVQEETFQSRPSFVEGTDESFERVPSRRRQYSVDFYSFASEETQTTYSDKKPRSSSFSSYLSNSCDHTESHLRYRRGRHSASTRKVHHGKGVFVVITAIRKKARMSRLSAPK